MIEISGQNGPSLEENCTNYIDQLDRFRNQLHLRRKGPSDFEQLGEASHLYVHSFLDCLETQQESDEVSLGEFTFEDVIRDADVVLDLVGGDTAYRSIGTLKPGGILIGLAPPTVDFIGPASRKNLRATIMLVEPDYASLEKITTLVEAGKIKPINPTVFSLANGVEALETMQRTDHGKIILRV